MAFAITKSCCADASCVSVCPVGCIHPAPGEPGFGSSEILHIDPAACIDCGACADACPVNAIYPVDRLVGTDRDYAAMNAAHFVESAQHSEAVGAEWSLNTGTSVPGSPLELAAVVADTVESDAAPEAWSSMPPRGRVAIVGAGASGLYTLKELLARTDAQITVIDALPTPGGLIRSGVAADHPATKLIQRTFDVALRHRRVTLTAGVELGRDVTLAELRERFDAVFVATGADVPRRLGVPGENHPRVRQARDVVAWAGGLPDAPDVTLGSTGRVVIVGTGNVALDLARLFTLPIEALERTDVADRALNTLRAKRIREVVVLGRGEAAAAAYTQAEFRALINTPGIDVRTIDADMPWAADDSPAEGEPPRITLVFGAQVQRFEAPEGAVLQAPTTLRDGTPVTSPDSAVAVTIERRAGAGRVPSIPPNGIPDTAMTLTADLVITSLGQKVGPLDALPLDPVTRGFRHDAGRVVGMPGVYVVGWAKRGAVGGIGANRQCAAETVGSYLQDAPHLPAPKRRANDLTRLVSTRGARVVGMRGAERIDHVEVRAGSAAGRPRIKLTSRDELLRASTSRLTRR